MILTQAHIVDSNIEINGADDLLTTVFFEKPRIRIGPDTRRCAFNGCLIKDGLVFISKTAEVKFEQCSLTRCSFNLSFAEMESLGMLKDCKLRDCCEMVGEHAETPA